MTASAVTVWINCQLSPIMCGQLNLTLLSIDVGSLKCLCVCVSFQEYRDSLPAGTGRSCRVSCGSLRPGAPDWSFTSDIGQPARPVGSPLAGSPTGSRPRWGGTPCFWTGSTSPALRCLWTIGLYCCFWWSHGFHRCCCSTEGCYSWC